MKKDIPAAVASAEGLPDAYRVTVRALLETYRRKLTRNLLRDRYYTMHQAPRNLGISVPPNLRNLEQVIGWPAKAVNALANRSQFDGYVCTDEDVAAALAGIVKVNGLKRKYRKAVKSELKHSCSFLAVTSSASGMPVVSAYAATAAAALWSERLNRIEAGMAVVDRDCTPRGNGEPIWVDVYTDDAVVTIRRAPGGSTWRATVAEHSMGRCLMEPMSYEATLERPFGSSRISRAVMNITDDAMRASVRSEVSAEFFTAPQKYLLGADPEALGSKSKWDAYIGNLFAVGKDVDGDVPQFGQLSQGSMQPHVDYMRALAARFSGETDVPISELGVVSDNPSSAEAIYAAKEPLVVDAQNLNADNAEALENVAYMALAVVNDTDFATEAARGVAVQARFRNPAMPSIVSQADAMTKMISAIPWLAESDVALEEFGFTDEQIQRLRSDRTKAMSRDIVARATQGTGLRVAGNPDVAAASLGVSLQ